MAKSKSGAQYWSDQIGKLGTFKYNDSGKLYSGYNTANDEFKSLYGNARANGLDAYKTGGIYADVANVDDLFDQVMNQEQFSYDPQTDALFQMYKKQYQQQGQRAMKNAMGVGAAMSGGYNSSAAQTASQTAYTGYMDALNEKASETYQNALDMYKYNSQQLLDRYNLVREANAAGNKAYYQKLGAASDNLNHAYNAWSSDREFQYGKYNDDRQYYLDRMKNAQQNEQWQKTYKLQKKGYTGK